MTKLLLETNGAVGAIDNEISPNNGMDSGPVDASSDSITLNTSNSFLFQQVRDAEASCGRLSLDELIYTLVGSL